MLGKSEHFLATSHAYWSLYDVVLWPARGDYAAGRAVHSTTPAQIYIFYVFTDINLGLNFLSAILYLHFVAMNIVISQYLQKSHEKNCRIVSTKTPVCGEGCAENAVSSRATQRGYFINVAVRARPLGLARNTE